MDDLQYCRDNFTGTYVSRMQLNMMLRHLEQDRKWRCHTIIANFMVKNRNFSAGYTEEEQASMANGLMKFRLSINSNYEFQLVNNNGKMIRYHMNIAHDGFWFTNFASQSIAKLESKTLTIEMTPLVPTPTGRKVTYEFYEDEHGSKGVKLKMFNERTSWKIHYKKTA